MTCFALVSTAPAFAAETKPTAETKAATGVEYSTATLNGVVNPEGSATEYRFEYGTASVEEHKTEWVSGGSGTTNVAVSSKLTALKVDTKYEFRLEAKNASGKATGATLTFTTKGSTKAPEFSPANGQTITGKGGEFQLNYLGTIVTCTNETMTAGNVTGKYTVGKVNLKFTGCKVTASVPGRAVGCEANSVGAPGGEIVINPLKGQLGAVPTTEAPDGVGLLLEAEGGFWAVLAKSANGRGELCSIETPLSGKLAVAVGTVGTKYVTNKLTAAIYEGWNIREITLASGETVMKPRLKASEEIATLAGVDDLTFGEATEVT